MTLDPTRLPRAAEYFRALPGGLASFPSCLVRSTVVEPYARDFSRLAAEPSLPPEVRDLLSGHAPSAWVSEVTFQLAYLVVRDLGFSDDAAFNAWIARINEELLDRPLLRSLVRLVSPSLLILGAAKRWAAFHQGSELVPGGASSEGGRTTTLTELRYPAGLFSGAFLSGLEHAFLAAVRASRGRDPRVVISASVPGCTTYAASFRG